MNELHEAIVLGFMLGSIGRKASSEVGLDCRKFEPHKDGEALSEDWIVANIAREFKQTAEETNCILNFAHHSYGISVVIHYPPSWECPSVLRHYCYDCGHYVQEDLPGDSRDWERAGVRVIHLSEGDE